MRTPDSGHEGEMSLEQEIEVTLFHYLDQTQGDGINHNNMIHVVNSEPRYSNIPEDELGRRVDEVILKLQGEGKIQAVYLGSSDIAYRGFVWKRK